MPTFFSSSSGNNPVGRVVQCTDEHAQGTLHFFTLDRNNDINFRAHRSIITRFTVAHQSNFQFLHTVGNEIYIYVFGDRVGQMTVSGLSFAADCGINSSGVGSGSHGFEGVLKWYEENRVSAKQDPVKVMVGSGEAINGFVVGMTADVVDHNIRLMSWNLSLMVLPKKGR